MSSFKKPKVEIFAPMYNEESLVGFFIDQYKKRFSNLEINLFDKGSTDKSVEIAQEKNVSIHRMYESDFDEQRQVAFKNTCWKQSKADFILICDIDEILDVNEDLILQNSFHAIKGEGYDMVGQGESVEMINKGVRNSKWFDKTLMFNRKKLREINYELGSHTCNPIFKNIFIKPKFITCKLYHYNYISEEYVLKKYESRATRISQKNIDLGLSNHYLMSDKSIRIEYKKVLNSAKIIF